MKNLIGIVLFLIITGCAVNSTEIVQNREVIVTPLVGPEVRDIDYPPPLNVTGNTTSFY